MFWRSARRICITDQITFCFFQSKTHSQSPSAAFSVEGANGWILLGKAPADFRRIVLATVGDKNNFVWRLNFFKRFYVFIDNRANMVRLIADRQDYRNKLVFSHLFAGAHCWRRLPVTRNGIAQPCVCLNSRSKFSQQKTKLCIYQGLEIFHYLQLREKHAHFWANRTFSSNSLHHRDAYNA